MIENNKPSVNHLTKIEIEMKYHQKKEIVNVWIGIYYQRENTNAKANVHRCHIMSGSQ